jgi:hypothetical protein
MSVFEDKFTVSGKKLLKILEYLSTLVFLQTITGNYLKNILFLMKFKQINEKLKNNCIKRSSVKSFT